MLAFFVFAGASLPVSAAEVIGGTAHLDPPQSVKYSGVVNFRPGDGEAVTVNPPRFSWSYTLDPTQAYADDSVHTFQFQVADNAQFTDPLVDRKVDNNFYNFLAPFPAGKKFWRVGYGGPDGVMTVWSDVRSFTISATTPSWDRSKLADESYLSAKAAHPHILFNASNRSTIRDWLVANNPQGDWTACISIADATIASAYWPNEMPAAAVMDEGTWAVRMAYVAFVYQLTQNAKYAGVAKQLELAANRYMAQNGPTQDDVSNSNTLAQLQALALGYDWCYDLLTASQRTVVLNALSQRCDTQKNVNHWWEDTESGLRKTPYYSTSKRANSHQFYNSQRSMLAALAGYGESAECRALLVLGLNYMLGVTYPYGFDGSQNQGRGYAVDQLFIGGFALNIHMICQASFPEVHFEKNPFWMTAVDWWDRILPVGHTQVHEPWGDGGSGALTAWGSTGFGRNLARFTGSGRAYRHYQNQLALPPYSGTPSSDNYLTLPLLYHFPIPTPATTPPGGQLFPDGWAISSSHSPSTNDGFKDGVGFVFQARARGGEGGHSHYSDLSYQAWAYGAPITDGGAGFSYYAKVPFAHYSLLVNGLGTVQPFPNPVEPYYSKFIGWKDTPDYTYVAADATAAYPRTNFLPSGWLIGGQFANVHSGAPLARLSKVQRHIVFMRKKYFIMYDDLANGTESTFSWLYHVHPNTLTLDAGNAQFNYKVRNTSGNDVTVYVKHITDPAKLSVTDLTGTDVAKNPITGENYYPYYGDTEYRAHALWVNNKTTAKDFHFMTVIYPVKPGGTVPQITRLDDFTVRVENGTEKDVISFDPATTQPATMIVDLAAVSSGIVLPVPNPPGGLRAHN
jgi:hypothetical protein